MQFLFFGAHCMPSIFSMRGRHKCKECALQQAQTEPKLNLQLLSGILFHLVHSTACCTWSKCRPLNRLTNYHTIFSIIMKCMSFAFIGTPIVCPKNNKCNTTQYFNLLLCHLRCVISMQHYLLNEMLMILHQFWTVVT